MIEKYLSIFNYLKEFARLREKIVRKIDNYEKCIPFIKIPQGKRYISIVRDLEEENETSFKSSWIKVIKPTKPPEFPDPSNKLIDWIDEVSLKKYNKTPELKEFIYNEQQQQIFLTDMPHIKNEFDEYFNNRWKKWSELYCVYEQKREIYKDLYEIYEKSIKFSENYQLVVGFGLFYLNDPEQVFIKRHILIADASIEFDSEKGVFIINEGVEGANLRIETEMLHDIKNINIINSEEELKKYIFEKDLQENPFSHDLKNAIEIFKNRCHSNANFVDQLEMPENKEETYPSIYYSPCLILRKRSLNTLSEVYKNIINQLENNSSISIPMLNDVVEVRESESINITFNNDEEYNSFFENIYLTKPANEEQKKIFEQLKYHSKVLVQGPPGTGKSHTIANIIGHLLAHGKRVLITAYTRRALTVVKNKLANEIKPLCVNLLGNDRESIKDLETSVNQIIEKVSNNNIEKMNVIENEEIKLHELKKKKSELGNKIIEMREKEQKHYKINEYYEGKLYDISIQIKNKSEKYKWFKDKIKNKNIINMITKQIKEYYNYALSFRNSDNNFNLQLPVLDKLIEVDVMRKFIVQKDDLHNYIKMNFKMILTDRFNDLENSDYDKVNNLIDNTNQYRELVQQTRNFNGLKNNILNECINGYYNKYNQILEKISPMMSPVYYSRLEIIQKMYNFKYPDNKTIKELHYDSANLLEYIHKGASLKKIKIFQKSEVKKLWYIKKEVLVNGSQCDNIEKLDKFKDYLKVILDYNELFELLEDKIKKKDSLLNQLYEIENLYKLLKDVMNTYNNIKELRQKTQIVFTYDSLDDVITKIDNLLVTLECVNKKISLKPTEENYNKTIKYLTEMNNANNSHTITQSLYDSLNVLNIDQYSQELKILIDLTNTFNEYKEYKNLKYELQKIVPIFINNIEKGDNLSAKQINKLEETLYWSNAREYIQNLINEDDIESKEKQIKVIEDKILKKQEKIASDRAWYFINKNLNAEQINCLIQYMQAIKKIGKGKGRNANKFRKIARENLDKAKKSIPAWIMPLYRIAETIKPIHNSFDFIIIDESSQIGPDALFLLYLTKNIIIVGDDKQTAPEYVGVKKSIIDNLISKHLSNFIDKEFYGTEFSFFDHAYKFCTRSGSGRIMLKEHFRCMPEIIEFSNKNYYFKSGNQIYPMRQYREDRLDPLISVFVENGYCEGKGQSLRNIPEAERLVDNLINCANDPIYKGRTFGVIILQGHQQKYEIEKLLIDKLGPEKMEDLKIVVGNSASFQGDERDVIFLSMVVSSDYNFMPLTKPADERRFNVAASRAKDQMWLFHSISLNDLHNKEDQRLLLLQHYSSYKNGELTQRIKEHEYLINRHREGPLPKPFDSWFEIDIYLDIIKNNYKIIPQYKVGAFRIDLVVIKANGEKIAVECDGDKYHEGEQLINDMNRQRILERCGWRFFRIRASDYYTNGVKTLDKLWKMLEISKSYDYQELNKKSMQVNEQIFREKPKSNSVPNNNDKNNVIKIEAVKENKKNNFNILDKKDELIEPQVELESDNNESTLPVMKNTYKINEYHDNSDMEWFKKTGLNKINYIIRLNPEKYSITDQEKKKLYNIWVIWLKDNKIIDENLKWYRNIYKRFESE